MLHIMLNDIACEREKIICVLNNEISFVYLGLASILQERLFSMIAIFIPQEKLQLWDFIFSSPRHLNSKKKY